MLKLELCKNGRDPIHYYLQSLVEYNFSEKTQNSFDRVREALPKIAKCLARDIDYGIKASKVINLLDGSFSDNSFKNSLEVTAYKMHGISDYSFNNLYQHILLLTDNAFSLEVFIELKNPLKIETRENWNSFNSQIIKTMINKLLELVAIDSDSYIKAGQGKQIKAIKKLCIKANKFERMPQDFFEINLQRISLDLEKTADFPNEVLTALSEYEGVV